MVIFTTVDLHGWSWVFDHLNVNLVAKDAYFAGSRQRWQWWHLPIGSIEPTAMWAMYWQYLPVLVGCIGPTTTSHKSQRSPSGLEGTHIRHIPSKSRKSWNSTAKSSRRALLWSKTCCVYAVYVLNHPIVWCLSAHWLQSHLLIANACTRLIERNSECKHRWGITESSIRTQNRITSHLTLLCSGTQLSVALAMA